MAVTGIYRKIRALHEDDTAVELRLKEQLARTRQVIAAAVADGRVTLEEHQAIEGEVQATASLTDRSLAFNRQINSLYCAAGADLDPDSEGARQRLPSLPGSEELVA